MGAYSAGDRVDELHDARQSGGVRFGGNSMAKVQDVAGGVGTGSDDLADVGLKDLPRGGQKSRVDVALERHSAPQCASGSSNGSR